MKKPSQPKQASPEKGVRYSLIDMFCLLEAWTGRPMKEILDWPIPKTLRMWKLYKQEKDQKPRM